MSACSLLTLASPLKALVRGLASSSHPSGSSQSVYTFITPILCTQPHFKCVNPTTPQLGWPPVAHVVLDPQLSVWCSKDVYICAPKLAKLPVQWRRWLKLSESSLPFTSLRPATYQFLTFTYKHSDTFPPKSNIDKWTSDSLIINRSLSMTACGQQPIGRWAVHVESGLKGK